MTRRTNQIRNWNTRARDKNVSWLIKMFPMSGSKELARAIFLKNQIWWLVYTRKIWRKKNQSFLWSTFCRFFLVEINPKRRRRRRKCVLFSLLFMVEMNWFLLDNQWPVVCSRSRGLAEDLLGLSLTWKPLFPSSQKVGRLIDMWCLCPIWFSIRHRAMRWAGLGRLWDDTFNRGATTTTAGWWPERPTL